MSTPEPPRDSWGRVLLDAALGFVLLVIGVGLFTATSGAIGKAAGIVIGAVGLVLVVGRLIAGRTSGRT